MFIYMNFGQNIIILTTGNCSAGENYVSGIIITLNSDATSSDCFSGECKSLTEVVKGESGYEKSGCKRRKIIFTKCNF